MRRFFPVTLANELKRKTLHVNPNAVAYLQPDSAGGCRIRFQDGHEIQIVEDEAYFRGATLLLTPRQARRIKDTIRANGKDGAG